MRNYFREHDWVTRCSDDTFAILMPETIGTNAESVADGLRLMVQERLALRDYRTEEHVKVTVSAAVVIGGGQNGDRAEQVLRQAEEAVARAKQAGRNRVEVVEISATQVPQPAQARGV
jgi:diguanylate cyclase